jgi:antitoxin HicB
MTIAWSEDDNLYLVSFPDVPGIVTHGTTPEEAARRGEEHIVIWLTSLLDAGGPVPEPSVTARCCGLGIAAPPGFPTAGCRRHPARCRVDRACMICSLGRRSMMRSATKTIHVEPGSELSQTLKAARTSGALVVVDTGESRYTIVVALAEPNQDLFADYDPTAAIAGVRALDDALAGVDREALLRDLRAQRAQDSNGRPA